MKLALLSDIHSNLRALDACLDHARARGVAAYAVLGDLVGYGAEPAQVVQRVRWLAAQGAVVIRGNHDAMALAPPARVETMDQLTAGWTHAQLGAEDLAFLAGLPLTHVEGATCLVHASVDAPERWYYVDNEPRARASLEAACADEAVRYVFGGHVHEQTLFFRGAGRSLMRFAPTAGAPVPVPAHRRWIATIGSVGQPRDGSPQAMYAIFDSARAELCFHRVDYDHAGAADAILGAGLPAFLAQRLGRGQ